MYEKLTNTQKEICRKGGNFVVRACPGSGKTFTVAAKMANLLKNWQYSHRGVAVISFTNVAWKEIQRQLNSFDINIPVEYPHFLGTIDSFINQFIFLPHGHLLLNCDCRPKLAGEPVYPWKYKKKWPIDPNQYFDSISLDINGEIIKTSHIDFKLQKFKKDGTEDKRFLSVERMKNQFFKKGYVNQSDANYFTMKLLEEYPFIAKTICLKFPFLIIDEAQDISEIQMKIINSFIDCGLANLVLVGDPDQAIFEWNDAKPELFNDKMRELDDFVIMNENWRSSQNICNFTYFLSGLDEKSYAVNKKIKNYEHEPLIWCYDSSNPNFDKLIGDFLELCEYEKIKLNPTNIAILARSKNLINQIISSIKNPGKINTNFNPWSQENFARELLYSKYLFDNQEFQQSFKLLEKTYMSILKGYPIYSDYELAEYVNKMGYFNFKKEVFDLIKIMPKTDSSIGDWIDNFKQNIRKSDFIHLEEHLEIDDSNDINFDEVFLDDNFDTDYRLSTIHKVKGETFEAVMLILKTRSANNKLYRNMLGCEGQIADNEELRNVYVGITRPKKVLILAVPNEDQKDWKRFFSEKQETLTCFFK